MKITCVKAYDIRGELGSQLNEDVAYRIGRAYGDLYQPKTVAVGCDIRLSSESLKQATISGLTDAGVNVLDLGMVGTEQVYFAAFSLDVQGGIEITASHNPMNYNGMKLVKENARPISIDTGLKDIQQIAESGEFKQPARKGTVKSYDILPEFIDHLLTYIDIPSIKPLKIIMNAGNGAAGPVVDALEARFKQEGIPVEFIKIHNTPDGHFPNGIPNPILLENQGVTRDAVLEHGADFGVAWDGDFDRCFLFDHTGRFIEGYYIVGLLAAAFLVKHPNQKIVHDPRLTWNTLKITEEYGGFPVQSKSGHAFIKDVMREHNAIYGGEMSAHHYFRDFGYCDSGMIPWLLVMDLLSKKSASLFELVDQMVNECPCSGELNFKVSDAKVVTQTILSHYEKENPALDYTDGLSVEFDSWRFNVRASNTEPLLRLNVESRGAQAADLLAEKTAELQSIIEKFVMI